MSKIKLNIKKFFFNKHKVSTRFVIKQEKKKAKERKRSYH